MSLPGTSGLLPEPRTVPGTNIEIVRPFDGRSLTTVLFDFDGTLSLERDGWPNLMVAANSAALAQAVPSLTVSQAIEWVIADIESTIGIPTYMQMKRLAVEILRLGGAPADPRRYKDVYNDALVAMVGSIHERLRAGGITQDDLRVAGGLDLLRSLRSRFADSIYLASGTDIAPIRESVELLGYSEFFGGRIIAAGSTGDPEACAKQIVVERLVCEHNLRPGQLLCFGDGTPEILRTHEAGGICVGVLTPDHSNYESQGHFTVSQKRQRLIAAGAHILIPDFQHAHALLTLLNSQQAH